MAINICLPCLKFSHASGTRPDNTVLWTHIQAINLFIVIEGEKKGSMSGELVLRVIHGTKVLENIDIAGYVDSAVTIRQKVGNRPHVDQLPIIGITKRCLLALRYRLKDGQSRRIQLRMQNLAECHQVVGVLRDRGLEFQEQRPFTGLSTATIAGHGPYDNRPLTTESRSGYFTSPLATAQPVTFEHRESPGTGTSNQLQASQPQSAHETESVFVKGLVTSHDMPPPRYFARDENFAPRAADPERPSTSQMYSSYTTPRQAIQSPPLRTEPAYLRQPGPPFDRDLSDTEQSASRSRPVGHGHGDRLRAEGTPIRADIPPLHDDPVERTRPEQSASQRPSSRPSSSALELPPLPKPKLAKEVSSSSGQQVSLPAQQRRNTHRTTRSSARKRPFEHEGLGAALPHDPLKSVTPDSESVSSQCGPGPDSRVQPSRMNDIMHSRKPLEERSTNARVSRMNSLVDAPHEIISNSAARPSPSRADLVSLHDRAVDTSSLLESPSRTSEVMSLETYARQSFSDRHANLDEFMITNLENPAFATLCQDVENWWRRIALGL